MAEGLAVTARPVLAGLAPGTTGTRMSVEWMPATTGLSEVEGVPLGGTGRSTTENWNHATSKAAAFTAPDEEAEPAPVAIVMFMFVSVVVLLFMTKPGVGATLLVRVVESLALASPLAVAAFDTAR